MQEGRGHDTYFKRLHLVDTDDKKQQHENHGDTELEPELSVVPLAQFTR